MLRAILSIRLTFANSELASEILLSYLSGFLLAPVAKSHLPDATKIVQLYVVGVLSSFVGDRRQ